MSVAIIVTDELFDGWRRHSAGPYTLLLQDQRLQHVAAGDLTQRDGLLPLAFLRPSTPLLRAGFVMPGLVEGHCHLFLDGDEKDFTARADHLKKPYDEFLETGRQSLAHNLAAGVTLLRDAGDVHGINGRLKQELGAGSPDILSAGMGLRKQKRYGSFLARETHGVQDLPGIVAEVATHADQVKIVLTGIIDFETGAMKGGVQFTPQEARLIVRTAHELGKLTFCHCSGVEGLQVAVDAGIDSIEHGFFMTRDILSVMRDKQISWVPTFIPVHFQWEYPEFCGWSEATCGELRRILDNHDRHLSLAYELGVPVIAGSDAGSYGSPHGRALVEDLLLMNRAGASLERVLASATSVPRRQWSYPSGDIVAGNEANLLCLAGSPFEDLEHLRRPLAVYHRGWRLGQPPAVGAGRMVEAAG